MKVKYKVSAPPDCVGCRVAIVGSRSFGPLGAVRGFIMQHCTAAKEIVSGGARGVDTCAQESALALGIPTKIYIPDWEGEGRSAGFKRNVLIIKRAQIVVAFWDGVSRGTRHSLRLAFRYKRRVHVVNNYARIVRKVAR